MFMWLLLVPQTMTYRWVSVKKTWLQCISKGVTSFCTNPSTYTCMWQCSFDYVFICLDIQDFYFNAICLPETWLSDSQDLSPFSIPGYQLINCPSSCSIHCGLIIYLRDEFSYDMKFIQRDSGLWDGLFVDIHWGNLNGKLTIGNIYRPPRNNNSNACVEKFLNELRPIISKLYKNNNNSGITEDMNLDLLKIDEREKFQAYFDLFVTNTFFPQIMYPTRTSKVQSCRSARNTRNRHSRMSATLIDQMFCRLKDINSAE